MVGAYSIERCDYMLSLDEARDTLRLDGTDNDAMIQALLSTIPDYIELTTGLDILAQQGEPLVDTVSTFLLKLWYNAEQSEAEKLQRVIDGLLKTITLKRTM